MSADDYARSVASVVAVQLVEAAGFDAVQKSSLDALSDLLLRYITELGTASHAYAELANRTDANPLDVAQALVDTGVSLADLKDFAKEQADIPFAQTIAPFPQVKKPALPPTFAQRSEVPPPHVPDFLPALPDMHTYSATPYYPQAETNLNEQQQLLVEQQQHGEKALIKLHASLAPMNMVLAEAAREKPLDGSLTAQMGGPGQAEEHGIIDSPFLGPVLWEDGAGAALPGTKHAAGHLAAAQLRESVEPVQWASLGQPSAEQPSLPKPFATWQWTAQLAKSLRLSSSDRPRQQDAFEGLVDEAGQEATKREVLKILAGRGEEEDDEGLVREQI